MSTKEVMVQKWNFLTGHKFSKLTLYAKASIFGAAVIGVWVLFLTPVIVYHSNQVEVNFTSNFSAHANYGIPSVRNCSVQFSFNEDSGFCSPLCGEWEEFTHSQVVGFAVSSSLLFILHMVGTIVSLLFSCYNYNIMFTFPAILLVYYLASPIILDIEFFIRLIGRNFLLCSSSDLLHTLEKSTAYCSFTGILNTFIFTLLSYLWLFLAMNIFWKVWFPVNARSAQVKGYTKYIHLAIVGLTLILSIVPIPAAFATGGYVISSFPPFLNYCYPRSSITFFYSYLLLFCIILPTGSTFNLFTLWKVLSVRKHLLKQSNRLRAESKLLVFFFYFAFASALSLTFFTIGSKNASQTQQGFVEYFTCEAIGEDPSNPCVLPVNRLGEQTFTIAAFAMYTIGAYVTLVYTIPMDKVKERWRAWNNKSTHTSTRSTVT